SGSIARRRMAATKHAGWISLAFLGPADDSVDVPTTVPKTSTKPSRHAKLGSATGNAQRKPPMMAQQRPVRAPRGYAELPHDHEFRTPGRGRVFRFFFRARLSLEEPSLYPFR